MLDAITASQVAMIQDQLRLQSINQNITNMQTPGYKRQIMETGRFDEQLQAGMTNIHPQLQTEQIHQQGTIVQSQNSHDLAISGEGFFAVQTEAGVFYTRRGDLHINERGELSLATGGQLLGKNGVLHVDDNHFSIDAQGAVYIDNHKVDQLNLVQFSHNEALKYQGQGLYQTTEAPLPAENSTRVLQGFIEQSNVKSLDEMMEMVKTSRHFEASQRVMRTADGLLSTAITQLGEGNV
ncbi:flagellar hook-basal body protein [Legionella fairfieldensis]|uniref:flagellar hook-basal body protein n=1 Tax=Legionella fairfieldensis TaxID=45064 RepID=UPI00048E7FD0|nr:flagellar hook basal-body protein [Legionella fairfieldensis]